MNVRLILRIALVRDMVCTLPNINIIFVTRKGSLNIAITNISWKVIFSSICISSVYYVTKEHYYTWAAMSTAKL
jgi:hypothetical protein